MFHLHSCCRLSYRRPSMWTAMSWLFLTTCSYITIPSMGEGLADSTLQKVRLLIWRMVGTFFTSYDLLRSFSPHSFFQTSSHFPHITHLVTSSSLESFVPPLLSLITFLVAFCLPHALTENNRYHSLFIILISLIPTIILRLSHDFKMLYYFQALNAPTFVLKAYVKHDQIA